MPSETIKKTVTDAVEDPPIGSSYQWEEGYYISFDPEKCTIEIKIKIKLVFADGITADEIKALKDSWATTIEHVWSGKFQICRLPSTNENCKCECYSVSIKAEFVETGEHHTVNVSKGPNRSNMTNWDTKDGSGDEAETPAHEVGHMMGLKDEYEDKANAPNRTVGDTDSIMRNDKDGVAKKSHYQFIADWLNKQVDGCNYFVK